jgi:signal transduction histidine kinase
LAAQASLAIQLTRLAQAARQAAILEERNQLARQIHDSLAHNLILQIKDNGSEFATTRLVKSEGIALRSIRERAVQIDAKPVIQTDPSRGTRITVTVPI